MAIDRVRWGVISTANIGRVAVNPAIQASGNGELVAVASRSEASARDFARGVRGRIPGRGAQAFDEITDRYLAERFGQRTPIDLKEQLSVLKHAVDRMRLRDQPHVG